MQCSDIYLIIIFPYRNMKRFVYNSKSFCHSTTTWSSGQTPALSLVSICTSLH